MAAPLVGISTYSTVATWGPWRGPAALVPTPYIELVAAAGGRPLLLPPYGALDGPGVGPTGPPAGREGSADPEASAGTEEKDGVGAGVEAAEVIGVLDALVLVGGGDLAPAAYGQPAHPEVTGVDPDRDRSERALLAAALDRDLPVLAICRGLQLLNVHLGGSLLQHLPDLVGHEGHRPGAGRFGEVDIATVPGTRIAEIMGPRDTVCCSHHQGVDRLGPGLVVTARSVEPPGRTVAGPPGGPATAGTVEAIELPDRRFVVAVQWHPEEAGDRRPFDAVVAAAR